MKRLFTIGIFATLLSITLCAQTTSFVVLGDMHMDKFDFHDMDYVYTRPSDWKQITKEYPYQTATYVPKLLSAVSNRVADGCSAVVQLGDLMEGVCGNQQLAEQMAQWAVELIDAAASPAKVILVKGNHDVSKSPGQPEAYKNIVLPYIRSQVGQDLEYPMYVYSLSKDVDLFVSEQFFSPDDMLPETALLDFLKQELPKSKAKYKFLLTHQPVVPVSQRCWHIFSGLRRKCDDPSLREEFLNLLAKNKVTVLCAHLHEYSKIVRKTKKGNLVQIMMVSTVDSFDSVTKVPKSQPYLTAQKVDSTWSARTYRQRQEIVEAENPYVKYYTKKRIPGYAVISVSNKGAEFSFYSGYSETPLETFLLDDLYKL